MYIMKFEKQKSFKTILKKFRHDSEQSMISEAAKILINLSLAWDFCSVLYNQGGLFAGLSIITGNWILVTLKLNGKFLPLIYARAESHFILFHFLN